MSKAAPSNSTLRLSSTTSITAVTAMIAAQRPVETNATRDYEESGGGGESEAVVGR